MKKMRRFQLFALALGISVCLALGVAVYTSSQVASTAAEPASEVVLASDVEWGPLNPARGDASPKAGTLWGDRIGSGASGFLVQFVEGFSSPPHIHNVTYRGVVIKGLVHNDDPGAQKMWLPAGSFWTQPAGEVHITAADDNSNLAYIEIEEGPYLVLPSEEAFDNGERPVNVDESNLVWLDASNIAWIDQAGVSASADGPKVAFLWGNPQDAQLNGTFVKLPDGFTGEIHDNSSVFRAVVIEGQLSHDGPNEANLKTLKPGSYFGASGKTVHQVSCQTGEECIIYVRAEGTFDVVPT